MINRILLKQDGSEVVKYNIPEYPIYASPSVSTQSWLYGVDPHWHDDIEFSIVTKGRMGYYINGKKIVATEGQCVFVNSGRTHYNYRIDGYTCEYRCVLVNPSVLACSSYIKNEFINAIVSENALDFKILEPAYKLDREVIMAIHEIFWLMNSDKNLSGLRVAGHAMIIADNMYKLLVCAADTTTKLDQRQTAVNSMVSYIWDNYSRNIKLKDIASAGLVSKCSCNSLFKEKFNETPMEYLTKYRLERSKELLKETTMNVTEIALAVGYNWQSYFSEAFRKFSGLTPTEYRLKHMTEVVDIDTV